MVVLKQVTARWHLRHVVQPEEEHMKYVSAQWVEPTTPDGQKYIRAIGDDGNEYFVASEDSDVPPWPEYLIDGGTITAADQTSDQITNAPDDLFGGPTLGDIYGNS